MKPADNSLLLSIAIPMHGDRFANVSTVVTALLRDPGRDFEVIVVDNCSPRDPSALFATIADDRLRFVRNPSDVGMVPNWNRCVELSRGRWIWIVHSDDRVVPHSLFSVRDAISRASDAGMLCFPGLDDFGSGRVVDRNESHPRHPHRLAAGSAAGRFLLAHAIYCSGVIVGRQVYESIGLFDEALRYSADEEFWLRVAASFSVYYDPVRLCVYRRDGGNSMMGAWALPEFADAYRETLRKGLEHFRASGEEVYEDLARLAGMRRTRNWVVIAFLCLCDGQAQQARHYLDLYAKDPAGRVTDRQVLFIRLLAKLPANLSRVLCRTALKLLTSRFALLGTRLVPR